MSGSFAKLLLQFRARRSKMCFPYAFQLLCCIRRHSGLERENNPKALPWIVFPQFLPAFTLQKPIWQILPLVHYLQIRTNKILSQLDIKQLILFCNFIKHSVNSSNCTGKWQTWGYGKYIQPVKPSMYWQWRKACSFLSALTHISSIHHPYKSLPAFFFSNSFNSSKSWLYQQCLLETTGTSHNLLLTAYPPSQNHSMTFWCPWHLPPNDWSVWAAPISCSTSHLALWHHLLYS